MSFATVLRKRNSERLIALLSAVAVVLSMMVIYAAPALAHHPTTVANQTCVDGDVVIEYTSESWLTTGADGSAHPNVVIEVSVEGGPWVQVDSGAYAAPDYAFSGSFSGEAYWGKAIRVRSQVVGNWPNGSSTGNSNPEATTAAFVVSQDCFNPSCPDDLLEYKVDPAAGGTHGPNDEFTITLGTSAQGQVFDWTSTVPIYQVIAKGGPGANVYDYSGATSDSGLHAPVNSNNGQYYGLSHITFCYQQPEDPVSTTFSIDGSCQLVDEVAIFAIAGEVGAGLTLEVAGETFTTGPFSVEVGAAGDYGYEVTVDPGYVLGDGSPSSSGTIVIEDCTPPPPPPSGYACVNGEVVFIEDATDFEGTIYETAEEAADDAGCIEVGASTTFTITGTCEAVDDVMSFAISGNLGEGVTLQVADQILTATGAFTIDVGAPGSYPYTVTLDEGFVLAEGSPAAEATIAIDDCTPTITIETLGVCVNDAPWLYYSVSVSGDVAPGSDTVDIRWFSSGGVEGTDPVHNYLGLPLTGNLTGSTLNADGSVAETITNANRVPWVGLRLAGDGVTPVDWPGWVFQNGEWLQQDDGFAWARQPGAFVALTVNPTGTDGLAYPPSTPTCSANPPDEVSDVEVDADDELPFTGIDAGRLAGIAVVMLGTGLVMLRRSRRLEDEV